MVAVHQLKLPVPMIATRGIAAVAAEALRTRDWHGTVVRELIGLTI